MPGRIQNVTVNAKAISVFFSARLRGPISRRCSSTYSETPEILLISGLLSSSRMMVSATNISAQTGSASPIHCANGIASPVACSMSSRPIRLGGLPTGVSRPPTLAP